jgi:hypothetical protein
VEAPTVATAHHDERSDIKTIDVTDRFFERQSLRDQFSGPPGYLRTTEVLTHELVHAVDIDQRRRSDRRARARPRFGLDDAPEHGVPDGYLRRRRPL